jgi:hypothetical protein
MLDWKCIATVYEGTPLSVYWYIECTHISGVRWQFKTYVALLSFKRKLEIPFFKSQTKDQRILIFLTYDVVYSCRWIQDPTP